MTERLALDVTWLPTAESGRTTSAWRPCRSPVFMGTDGVSAARTSRLPPAMIFVARRIDARVELTKPLDFCCNCGRDADIDLVETPLQRTRFFLVFGTELTVREEFPYCRACRRSAGRVRPGTLSKLLMAALTTSIFFLVIVVSESVLPDSMRTSPFWWSVALAVVASFGYFAFRARGGTPRSYYQPVRLADARMRDGHLQRLRLEFANAAYGGLFARANADLVAAGALEVR